jgi:hypothetical protein
MDSPLASYRPFSPYGEDSEGSRVSYPVVCEGDVKGLVTSVLMANIAGGAPPMFGDLKYVCDEYLCFRTAAVHQYITPPIRRTLPMYCLMWRSGRNARALPDAPWATGPSRAQSPWQGSSGPKGAYYMQLGLGQIREAKDMAQGPCSWGQTWPSARVDLGVSPDVLCQPPDQTTIPCWQATTSQSCSMLAGRWAWQL